MKEDLVQMILKMCGSKKGSIFKRLSTTGNERWVRPSESIVLKTEIHLVTRDPSSEAEILL